MPIDTDDLSQNTYNAIILESDKFNHDLTLEFGCLSYECDDENDFILKCKRLIDEMLRYDRAEMNDLFFGKPPNKKEFHQALRKILSNLESL